MENLNTQENVNEQKTPKTPKEKVIFGLKIGGNVLFYLVIAALLLFSIMNINAGSRNGGFPNLFGKGFLSVTTSSMDGDNDDYKIKSFKEGSLLYENVFKGKDCSSLEVGDVITFYDPTLKALNTHRVVYVHTDYSYVIAMGDKIAMTFTFDINDKESIFDLESAGHIQTITVENIKGIVTGVNPGAGKVLTNIQDNWLWYFVLPVLAFLLFEVFMVVRNVMELKGAKQKAEIASDKEAMMSEVEAMKEEMRKQLLAELAAEQAKAAAPQVEETPVAEEAPVEAEVVEETQVEEVAVNEAPAETTEEDPKAE